MAEAAEQTPEAEPLTELEVDLTLSVWSRKRFDDEVQAWINQEAA